MSAQKEKINNRNEENEDDLLKPCFQISPGVEFKDVPTTGEEFLLKVMRERNNYDAITSCKMDISMFAKNQNSFIQESLPAEVSSKLKPTIEWQNIQVADFSEIRMYVARLREKYPKNIKSIKREPCTLSHWKSFFNCSEPTLSCVLGMKSALIDCGLEMITEILNEVQPGETINYRLGQWIYSLLVCVRHPLLSETTCVLRGLARKCAEIRSHINPDSEIAAEAVAPLNIFICLVGRYFEQFDLADR